MNKIIKSIELALANELRERDFYLQQAQRTKNPVGKKMFASIAEDENEHYERLKKIHAELSSQGTWPETVSKVVKGTDVMEVLRSVTKLVDTAGHSDDDDREALKTAIEFETKGYEFYTGLSSSATSNDEKMFFNRLATMEKEHLLSLKQTLFYFEDPASWFAEQEKPSLEG